MASSFTGLPISIRTPKARSTPPGSLNDGDFVRHWSLAIARVDISFMMPRRPVYVQLLYEGLKRNALKRRTLSLINSKGKWFFMSIFLPILYHIVFDQITTRIPTLCLLDNFVRQWTPSMKFYIIQSTDLFSCNYLQIVFSPMVVGLWTCQNIFERCWQLVHHTDNIICPPKDMGNREEAGTYILSKYIGPWMKQLCIPVILIVRIS